MFSSVLVANRGEIAVRVMRTLRRLGVRSVAVYTEIDVTSPHVAAADVAVRITDYLDGDGVVAAGIGAGAEAVHPGYGFLAENAGFARAVATAGLTWIGPPPAAIESMGDKIRAKATVGAAGVPLVPGSSGSGLDDAAVAVAAREVGFPVLLKPSAGGGGKGMHVVTADADLEPAIAAARREARGSFGDDTLLVERYVTNPRHVEIQVLADAHGTVVHLGERECSLQRRHQKVVEEAPSTVLDEAQRAAMGGAAVDAARACGYVGAGTVEFVTNSDASEFFFLEMNTRLQVEHPVTEMVARVRGASVDLVAEQLRVAAGDPLGYDQDDVTLDGHAVEVRVYAEDPARGFLPTGGRVLDLVWPGGDGAQRSSTGQGGDGAQRSSTGPGGDGAQGSSTGGVRVDAGVAVGTEVGSRYDPMLAKVITHGRDRASALDRLDAALAHTAVLGLGTNVSWLRTLLADDDVRAGRLDTGLVERLPVPAGDVPDDILAAAALAGLLRLPETDDPFGRLGGWRVGGSPAPARWRLVPLGGEAVDVAVTGRAHDATVTIERVAGDDDGGGSNGDGGNGDGAGAPVPAARPVSGRRDGADLVVTLDGTTRRYRTAEHAGVLWLSRDGHGWAVREQQRLTAASSAGGASDGPLTAPMPGTVTVVEVAEGDRVVAGQRLLVVEAMKMEHVIAAPVDGVVTDLAARAGRAVAMDAPLVTVVPDGDGPRNRGPDPGAG